MSKDIAATLANLARVPGLDVAEGLAMLRGRPDRYLAVLQLFVDSHVSDMPRLIDYLARGDRDAAQRVAHTLKGAAAMLSVTRLATAAQVMESRLHPDVAVNRDDIRTEMNIINDELAELVAALSAAEG
jgi:HPt (histidine-containing phosphotransfer) domain-containing protein